MDDETAFRVLWWIGDALGWIGFVLALWGIATDGHQEERHGDRRLVDDTEIPLSFVDAAQNRPTNRPSTTP